MKEEDNTPIINFHEKLVQKYIEQKRPPIELRDQVDIGYTFEEGILEIYEIRPKWKSINVKVKTSVARVKYFKSRKLWRIYWMRGSGKWEMYESNEGVKDLSEFFKILDEDMAKLQIQCHSLHPKWNYSISPEGKKNN